jgi:hypothetical protein
MPMTQNKLVKASNVFLLTPTDSSSFQCETVGWWVYLHDKTCESHVLSCNLFGHRGHMILHIEMEFKLDLGNSIRLKFIHHNTD